MIRVQDLPTKPAYRVYLYCPMCHGEYSACRGDYFMADPRTVMTCCDEPMELVRERRMIIPIKSKDAESA